MKIICFNENTSVKNRFQIPPKLNIKILAVYKCGNILPIGKEILISAFR
jgi:hypothetical protein